MSETTAPVVVIGGGLAGLAAATFVARAGKPVVLFERSAELGGRAVTSESGGFRFNLGPHALYQGGAADRALKEFGVNFSGGHPPTDSGVTIFEGALDRLPGGPRGLLATHLISARGKLQLAAFLAALPRMRLERLQYTTLADWAEGRFREPMLRRLILALLRLSTYTNADDRTSAAAALSQLRAGLKGVWYVDGGWQVLVDGLRVAAVAAGVRIVNSTRVEALDLEAGRVVGVRLAADWQAASAVIIAGTPSTATELTGATFDAVPIQAACLDVALRSLPQPARLFALGLDQAVYFSVHSATAKLAPTGSALVSLGKYLKPGAAADPRADEAELEAVFDLVQPGWRTQVIERRFLPKLAVHHGMALAELGGLAGRPSVRVQGIENAFLAGDWVGPEGLLTDAVFASARSAALMAGEVAVVPRATIAAR